MGKLDKIHGTNNNKGGAYRAKYDSDDNLKPEYKQTTEKPEDPEEQPCSQRSKFQVT